MTHINGTIQGERAEREPLDWGCLLSEHGSWLRTVVLARVGERQAVDDVMQEVALAAVEQKSPLSDRSKVAPWLYRVAVVKSIRYRRQRARQGKHQAAYATSDLWCGFNESFQKRQDPLAGLLLSERNEMLRQALEQLSSRDAEILKLKYGARWTYREISERLGIDEDAVDRRLQRARKQLRWQLEHFGINRES